MVKACIVAVTVTVTVSVTIHNPVPKPFAKIFSSGHYSIKPSAYKRTFEAGLDLSRTDMTLDGVEL